MYYLDLLHGLMFISTTGIVRAVVIIFITGIMESINEKISKGSIVLSWLLHRFSSLCAFDSYVYRNII